MNLVERWFAELTTKWLPRGTHRIVIELAQSINHWVGTWNDDHPRRGEASGARRNPRGGDRLARPGDVQDRPEKSLREFLRLVRSVEPLDRPLWTTWYRARAVSCHSRTAPWRTSRDEPRREPGADDDIYARLGVPAGASAEDIMGAYRRLARERHPDANPAANANAFSDLTDAYEVLRDPARRRAYDDTRSERARAASDASGVRVPIRYTQSPTAGARGGRAQREADALAEVELALTFDQAALGTTAVVQVETESSCPYCSGTRVAAPAPCPDCGGTGHTTRVTNSIRMRLECRRCDGSGHAPATPCAACGGTRARRAVHDVTVRIPAGVEDGARLRLPVAGDEFMAVVRTGTHPYFERRGKDIALRLPLTVAEAALGGVVSVATLTGALAVRIPPGSRHGRTLRARGRGIPQANGPGDWASPGTVEGF